MDTTLVSPLSGSGQPCRWGGRVQGAALALARRRKERTYPELLRPLGALPLGCLGRRVTRQPPLRAPSREPRRERCRVARWSALLSHAAMSAFAATFTQRAGALSHADGALQVRRPSPRAGCLPASCTSHSRWPPAYKWLVCLRCPAAPLKQGFRGDKPRRWRKGARKKTGRIAHQPS